jgi:hypothetical protein
MPKPESAVEYRIVAMDKGELSSLFAGAVFANERELLREYGCAAAATPPYDVLRIEQRHVGPWEPAPAAMQAAPRRVSQT